MTDWQPIATAPKDGRRILIYYKRLNQAKNEWGTIRIGKWTKTIWALDMAGHVRTDITHWMPLPVAPNVQAPSVNMAVAEQNSAYPLENEHSAVPE